MKGNPELETTRHMKNCIRRHEICRVWDVSLPHNLFPRLRVFLPPYETVFREVWTVCNHYVTSRSNRINLRFNSPPGVFRNTTNLNFKNISAKSSRFKQLPLMRNIKMPVNTLRKDKSKHFSGRAARLASCLPVYSDHEKQKCQVTI